MTTSKNILFRSLLLLALSTATATLGVGQVVKTWTLDANSFKKKEGGKQEEGGNDCATQIDLALKAANALHYVRENVNGMIYNGGYITKDRKQAIEDNMAILETYMPELKNYQEKADAMVPLSDNCQKKGQKYLTAETIAALKGHTDRVRKGAAEALTDLESYADEAQEEVGADDDIFVSSDEPAGDPAKAEQLVKYGRTALDVLDKVLERHPGLQTELSGRIAALRKRYDGLMAKVGSAKEAVFTSPYHKAHAGTISATAGEVTPGQEAGKIKTEWKPGEDLYFTVFAPNYLQEFTPNGDFAVKFMVGEREVTTVDVWLKGNGTKNGDEDALEKGSFISFFLFGPNPKDNFDKTWASRDQLKEVFGTLARVTPQRHEMRIIFQDRSGEKIAEGKFFMDLTGQPTGDGNWATKAVKDMEVYKETGRRNDMFSWCDFSNKLNDPSLKTKTEAKIVEMGKGKVKAARVFFQDDRWTAVINGAGIPMFREIYYHFILEDVNGNYYVGNDILEQDGLLGGGFDTKQVKPAFGPLEDDGSALRDLWDYNNRGNTMWMVKVPKEKITPYWK
jgi:hypothetical protein